MARSTRSSPAPPDPDSPSHASSLVLDAQDAFHDLRKLDQAYACLERLLAATAGCQRDEFSLAPGEIGALIDAVNGDFRTRAARAQPALQSALDACTRAESTKSGALRPA